MTEPMSPTEVANDYRSSLSDLTMNSKPLITMLTMLAEENKFYASHIVEVLTSYIKETTTKLPVMYLIDSIIKNVGGEYKRLFNNNSLVNIFVNAFKSMDETSRRKMYELRQTWNEVFPASRLYLLDATVKETDPAWPSPVKNRIASSNIYVNPKFKGHKTKQSSSASYSAKNTTDDNFPKAFTTEATKKSKSPSHYNQIIKNPMTSMSKVDTYGRNKKVPPSVAQPSDNKNNLYVAPWKAREMMPQTGPKIEKKILPIKDPIINTKSTPPTDPRLVKNSRSSSRDPRLSKMIGKADLFVSPVDAARVTVSKPVISEGSNKTPIVPADGTSGSSAASVYATNVKRNPYSEKLTPTNPIKSSSLRPKKSSTKEQERIKEADANPRIARDEYYKKYMMDKIVRNESQAVSPKKDERVKELTRHKRSSSRSSKVDQLPPPPQPEVVPSRAIQPSVQPLPITLKQPIVDSRPIYKKKTEPNQASQSKSKYEQIQASQHKGNPELTQTSQAKGKPESIQASQIKNKSESIQTSQIKSKPESIQASQIKNKPESIQVSQIKSKPESIPASKARPEPILHSQARPEPILHSQAKSKPESIPASQAKPQTIQTNLSKSKTDSVPKPTSKFVGKIPKKISTEKRMSNEKTFVSASSLALSSEPISSPESDTINTMKNRPTKTAPAVVELQPAAAGIPQIKSKPSPVANLFGSEDIDLRKLSLPKAFLTTTTSTSNYSLGAPIDQVAARPVLVDQFMSKPAFTDQAAARPVLVDQFGTKSAFGDQVAAKAVLADQVPKPVISDRGFAKPVFEGPVGPRLVESVRPTVEVEDMEVEEATMPTRRLSVYKPNSASWEKFRDRNPEYKEYHRQASIPGRDRHYDENTQNMVAFPGDYGSGSEWRRGTVGRYSNSYEEDDAPELPGLPNDILQAVQRNTTSHKMMIDGVPREIRSYGDKAVILLNWDDPRLISFQHASCDVYFEEENFSLPLTTGEGYKEFYLCGYRHQIKLGVPSQELFIDGKGYQCFFGQQPIVIFLDGKNHTVGLTGSPPQVNISRERNSSYLAGQVELIINTKRVINIYLDPMPQRFHICGRAFIMKFIDNLRAFTLNGVRFEAKYNYRSYYIRVRGIRYCFRLSRLPKGIIPGEVCIEGMDADQSKLFPFYATNLPVLNPDPMPLQPSGSEGNLSLQINIITPSRTPVRRNTHGPFAFTSGNGIANTMSNITPGFYQSEDSLPIEPSTSVKEASKAPVDINSILNSLVKSGVIKDAPVEPMASSQELNQQDDRTYEEDNSKELPATADLWTNKTLKTRNVQLIEKLVKGKPCMTCGVRFDPNRNDLIKAHHDWHFRTNTRQQLSTKKANYRKFLLNSKEWEIYEEIEDLDDRTSSMFENENGNNVEHNSENEVENIPSVMVTPDKPELAVCPACHETFDQYFDDETEDWRYRYAICVEGSNYHPGCHEDVLKQISKAEAAEKLLAEQKILEEREAREKLLRAEKEMKENQLNVERIKNSEEKESNSIADIDRVILQGEGSTKLTPEEEETQLAMEKEKTIKAANEKQKALEEEEKAAAERDRQKAIEEEKAAERNRLAAAEREEKEKQKVLEEKRLAVERETARKQKLEEKEREELERKKLEEENLAKYRELTERIESEKRKLAEKEESESKRRRLSRGEDQAAKETTTRDEQQTMPHIFIRNDMQMIAASDVNVTEALLAPISNSAELVTPIEPMEVDSISNDDTPSNRENYDVCLEQQIPIESNSDRRDDVSDRIAIHTFAEPETPHVSLTDNEIQIDDDTTNVVLEKEPLEPAQFTALRGITVKDEPSDIAETTPIIPLLLADLPIKMEVVDEPEEVEEVSILEAVDEPENVAPVTTNILESSIDGNTDQSMPVSIRNTSAVPVIRINVAKHHVDAVQTENADDDDEPEKTSHVEESVEEFIPPPFTFDPLSKPLFEGVDLIEQPLVSQGIEVASACSIM